VLVGIHRLRRWRINGATRLPQSERASVNRVLGRAITHAASRWLIIIETRVVHVGFVGGKMTLGLALLQIFQFYPAIYLPTNILHLYIMRGWCSRPMFMPQCQETSGTHTSVSCGVAEPHTDCRLYQWSSTWGARRHLMGVRKIKIRPRIEVPETRSVFLLAGQNHINN
jgi:hypothetical protein